MKRNNGVFEMLSNVIAFTCYLLPIEFINDVTIQLFYSIYLQKCFINAAECVFSIPFVLTAIINPESIIACR